MAVYDAAFPVQDYFPRIKDNFCLIVVGVLLRGDQVLLIQESKRSCYGKYFLPAGRLEPHETLLDGVKREVLEESGLEFLPKQLVLLESNGSCWFSITFIGEAIGGRLKTVPDTESLQARWFEVSDVANAESDWFSVHGVHHPGRPVCGAAKPGSFQLRAPVMHMIRAAQRFYRSTEAEAISRGISLPDEQSDDLNCILFRLVVIRMQQAGVSSIENKPSHMLVRNTRPMQLPTFRINLIDPLKAITLALNCMMPQISTTAAFDVKRIGILKMTFVPHQRDQASDQVFTADGFMLTLLIRLAPEISPLPITSDRFKWIDIQPNTDKLNTEITELPSWIVQLPLNTDLLPLYRF
ncbi:Nucleoside diphosphate-linked moiety X motif 18 [Fasciolopsis buskii]|uniref:Nucleoside diphosphate-linked moiety X motif 18 n=1 Tax=Fasciolopsis buskii TaxID=27845 RepID=A0A8E0RYH9_9TREM|nr:Nucleoside diphosphate-linked moiety X motif 18 [Fasciolopsis buski]